MESKPTVKLLLLFLSLSLNLFAIDGKIKVFISSNDAIYTSQKITVSVELLSSAFSITDAKITFPASNKYIVQAPESASYLGQEEVDDEDWQMVHYDYDVYALQAGKIEIPSVLVSFTASMGYGQPKKEFALKSDALSFDVKAPAGIKNNQFVLVTDNYTLISERKPEKTQLIVGDAIELSITQKGHDVPDILLKPMDYKSNAMLRVYDKEPELKSGLKGKYDVSRTDRFTFVASGEGNVTIPSLETVWWNSETKKVQVEKIPEMTFEILADPQIAIDAKKAQQKKLLLSVTVAFLILLSLYAIFASKIRNYRQERQRMYVESEEGKFDVLLGCIEANDVSGIYTHFYHWLVAIAPELSRGGFSALVKKQPSFEMSLQHLEEIVLDSTQEFDTVYFTQELRKLRASLLAGKQGEIYSLPKKINPN